MKEGRLATNGFFNTQKRSTGNYTLSVRFKGKMGGGPTLDFDSLIRGLKTFKIGFESLFAVERNVLKRHQNSCVKLFSLSFNSTAATLSSFQLQTVGNFVEKLYPLLVDSSC
jgi:hypothetical protein